MRDSYIVSSLAGLFQVLSRFSVFWLLRAILPKWAHSYAFVDTWAIANLLLAGLSLAAAGSGIVPHCRSIVLIYASVRVAELLIYQLNVLLFDAYRAKRDGQPYGVRSYLRLVILALCNYAECLLWFACIYCTQHVHFTSSTPALSTVCGALYFSTVTVTTLGYGDIHPADGSGATIVMIQSAVGFFMTLMILARFIGLLRVPASKDPSEG